MVLCLGKKPKAPSKDRALIISSPITVSILELTNGMAMLILLESGMVKSTDFLLLTMACWGLNKKSLKVAPSNIFSSFVLMAISLRYYSSIFFQSCEYHYMLHDVHWEIRSF